MNIDLKSVTKIIYNGQEITQLNDSNGNKLWPREAPWIDVFEGSKIVDTDVNYKGSYDYNLGVNMDFISGQKIYMPTGVSLDSNKTYEWVIDYTVLGGTNRLPVSSTIDYRNNFKPNAKGSTNIIKLIASLTLGTQTYEPNILISYKRSSTDGDYIDISGKIAKQNNSSFLMTYGSGIQINITKIQVREKS